MSSDNSYSREEQAIPTLGKSSHTLSNQRCTKCVFWVNNDMTAHLMRKGPVLYCHIPASGLPVHNFLSFHHEMLDGQKMGKSRRLKIKSSHSASALSCNAVLSEYPCLQKKNTQISKVGLGTGPKPCYTCRRICVPDAVCFPHIANQAGK